MMLELNNYYIQELENLTDLFTNIFVIIDDIYKEIIPIGIRNRRNIKDSKLSDSEIITISIVGELLTIDSEKSFFSLLKREYKEELGIDIIVEDFCGISENIFTYQGKNAHELILFYNIKIQDKDVREKYHIIDDNCESDAYWIDVNEFKNNKKIIYPEQIFKYI